MSIYARAAIVLASVLLVLGIGWKVHRAGVVSGRTEVQAKWDADRVKLQAAVHAQEVRNRELQRAAEKRYTVQAGVRDRFMTQTITEVRYAAAPLASCPVPELVRLYLNAASGCARGDSAAPCGDGKPVLNAR